jgi:ribosomal RNA-processing protein 12
LSTVDILQPKRKRLLDLLLGVVIERAELRDLLPSSGLRSQTKNQNHQTSRFIFPHFSFHSELFKKSKTTISMMDEESSFFQVLENLNGLSNKRDHRLLRLASVTAALKDVSGGDPSAAKFFAAAVETLEGTLHQKHQEADTILDSLSTQTALLDIISLTIAHVAPATLAATASLSSRALRCVVHSWQSFGIQEAQSVIFDTQDGLGGISALLCSSCKDVSGLLRHLPIAADDNTVANLTRSTLLSLLKDSRPRVKSAAISELCGLLAMDLPKCHNIVHKETTKYVKKEMERSLKSTVEEEASRDLVDLLGFLQHAIIFIDFTTIGTHLMEVLISLLAACSSSSSNRPVFVTKLGDTRRQILTINSILSTILAMLEHEVSGPKEKTLCAFASRVLASLVQVQPTLAYRHGEVENDLLESGRSIFGQVMLSSCERLFAGGEAKTASKLLPLTIHHVVNLSRPSDSLLDNVVAETLMPELSQLLRMQLRDLKTTEPVIHEKCCRDSLTAMEIVLQSSFQPTWMVSLKPLVILLQQMNPRNEKVQVCIETMLILRCQISEDTNFHHSIDDAISSLVQEIGIEQFWDQIKLSELSLSTDERSAKGGKSIEGFVLLEPTVSDDFTRTKGILKNLPWLLQLMKSAGSLGGRYDLHLSFFQNTILPLARDYDSQSMKNAPKEVLYKRKVLALWGLFPCFCRNPVDLVSSFPTFVPLLVRAMNDKRYPELVVSDSKMGR